MSRRYFYTDPLAAAWMAKHFGMRFTGDAFCLTFGRFGEYIQYVPERFVVHPDWLHLLEPQEGDLVKFTENAIRSDFEGRAPFEGFRPPYRTSDSAFDVEKILLRNGIPFHWPQSEESEGA